MIGNAALWSFLLVSLALCLLSVVVILRRYDGFPEPRPADPT
jgi:ABC-type Mn2+/Zn2+ transport system permease subunit